ncbi:MAG: accessory Sec system glycosylation chaperone GtfB, partial [Acetatifactor sp.]|nr:accessory Sec system glycosylation chaperone GtfB [Acetatifactor sp.]
ELIRALPQMHFHIAALTEMSSKLTGLGSYDNVSLYPGVKMDILDGLFAKCDYYFDINHEVEIVSAVRRAFLNNQLIFAFGETVHNRDYVAEEHIYPVNEFKKMVSDISLALADEAVLEDGLKKQRDAELAETAERYAEL